MGRAFQVASGAIWIAIWPALGWAGQGVAVGAAPAEVGVSYGSSNGAPTMGPIVTVNFGTRDALDFSAAFGVERHDLDVRDVYAAQYRRTVFRANRASIALSAGAGIVRSSWDYRTIFFGNADEDAGSSISPAVIGGVSGSWDLTRRLTVRAGYQFNLGSASSHQGTLALTVPVGARPGIARARTARPSAASVQPSGSPIRLRAGQKVWVMSSDGREVAADVVELSDDAIILARNRGVLRFDRSDIHRIETPDPITDGLVRGIFIGAGAGAGMTLLACSGQCYEYTGLYLLTSALAGAGMGALMGTLGDHLIEHRRVVYESSRTTRLRVAPTLSPASAGMRATLTW